MEEKEEGVEARPEVRKKRAHRGRFIARDRCMVNEVHQRRSSLDRLLSETNPRAVPTVRWPASECALRRQPAHRTLPQYGLGALRLVAVEEKVREEREREKERRARGRRRD